MLGGIRLGGKHLYMIPALGVGYARWTEDLCTDHIICTPEVAAQYAEKGGVVSYDFGFHATRSFGGLGLNIFGTAGAPKRNLMAMVFSLELGSFGR